MTRHPLEAAWPPLRYVEPVFQRDPTPEALALERQVIADAVAEAVEMHPHLDDTAIALIVTQGVGATDHTPGEVRAFIESHLSTRLAYA